MVHTGPLVQGQILRTPNPPTLATRVGGGCIKEAGVGRIKFLPQGGSKYSHVYPPPLKMPSGPKRGEGSLELFWSEEVHFGPFGSANCTVATPEKFN